MLRMYALGAALAVGFAAGTAAAQTKWDLPAGYPAGNFHTRNLVEFANDVKAASGGKLEITIHPGASLFKVPEIKRAVQTGQAQVGELLMANVENEDAVYGVDTVPFLATSFDDAAKLWKAQRPFVERKLASQGMTLLYAVPWPSQGIYAKKEINRVEDMKGLKFRAYNAATSRISELLGAQPVTIQAADLAQALATGVVNSFFSSGSTGYDTKAWESLTHFYDTQAWLPKNMVFANSAAMAKLDDATRKAIVDAAARAETRGWQMARGEQTEKLAALAEKGMKVQPPSPELATGFRKIGETLTEEWIAKASADGKAAVEAYKKM